MKAASHSWKHCLTFGLVNLQTEFAQQRDIAIGGGVFGGEELVTIEDGVGAGEKTQCLAFTRNSRATGGETNARAGKSEAGDANQPNEVNRKSKIGNRKLLDPMPAGR